MSRPDDDLERNALDWDAAPVLAALAEADAVAPPAAGRDRLLRVAAAAPPPLAEPVTPVALYASRVAAMRELLHDLPADGWHRPAAPYQWTVHGLVAHLLVIERYTASVLGIGPAPFGPGDDHLALGADEIALELAADPSATAARWSSAAQSIVDHIHSDAFRPDAPAPLHEWPFNGASALVARAFELWTHADDIERAVGSAGSPTPAGELRAMSMFSVNTLPYTIALASPDVAMAPARVVLTGDGGGTFDIGGDGQRRALVVADVVDYCRMVARRIEPEALDVSIEGDDRLALGLLRAAQVFAV